MQNFIKGKLNNKEYNILRIEKKQSNFIVKDIIIIVRGTLC